MSNQKYFEFKSHDSDSENNEIDNQSDTCIVPGLDSGCFETTNKNTIPISDEERLKKLHEESIQQEEEFKQQSELQEKYEARIKESIDEIKPYAEGNNLSPLMAALILADQNISTNPENRNKITSILREVVTELINEDDIGAAYMIKIESETQNFTPMQFTAANIHEVLADMIDSTLTLLYKKYDDTKVNERIELIFRPTEEDGLHLIHLLALSNVSNFNCYNKLLIERGDVRSINDINATATINTTENNETISFSQVTPLMLAAMSGNVAAFEAIISMMHGPKQKEEALSKEAIISETNESFSFNDFMRLCDDDKAKQMLNILNRQNPPMTNFLVETADHKSASSPAQSIVGRK